MAESRGDVALRCQCGIADDPASALLWMRSRDPRLREAALAALQTGRSRRSHGASSGVAWLRTAGPPALLRAVLRARLDRDPRIRALAAWVLDMSATVHTVHDLPGPTRIERLSLRQREALLRSLSTACSRDPRWRPLLGDLLDDPCCTVRGRAATSFVHAVSGRGPLGVGSDERLRPTAAELEAVRSQRPTEPCAHARWRQDAFLATFGEEGEQAEAVERLLADDNPYIRSHAARSGLESALVRLAADDDLGARESVGDGWVGPWPPVPAEEADPDDVYAAFCARWLEVFGPRSRASLVSDERARLLAALEELPEPELAEARGLLDDVETADSAAARITAAARLRQVAVSDEFESAYRDHQVTCILLGTLADSPLLDDALDHWWNSFTHLPACFHHSMTGTVTVTTLGDHASLAYEPPSCWPAERWSNWWAEADARLFHAVQRPWHASYGGWSSSWTTSTTDPRWRMRLARLGVRAQGLLQDSDVALAPAQRARLSRVAQFRPGGRLGASRDGVWPPQFPDPTAATARARKYAARRHPQT